MHSIFAIIKKASLLIIILFFSFSVNAEIYKWTDKNGKVHYSDKPIQEDSKKLSIKKGPSQDAIQEAKNRASSLINHQRKVREIANDNAREKKKSDQQEKIKKDIMSAACKQAKNDMILLGHRGAAYVTNEKGERTFFTDAEKNEMIAQLKSDIKKHC